MNLEILNTLNDVIKDRKMHPNDNSYTCQLLKQGDNKIIKKLGEENAEFIKALLTEPNDLIAGEAADYLYHMMVALRHKDIDFSLVLDELARRHK